EFDGDLDSPWALSEEDSQICKRGAEGKRMSVFRRGNVWWFKFRLNGQVVRESAKTNSKTIARLAERTRRRELELGVNRVQKRKNMPLFSLAAREWLDRKRITSAHATAETYRYFIEGLIRNFGERLVSDIDHEDIAALQFQAPAGRQ